MRSDESTDILVFSAILTIVGLYFLYQYVAANGLLVFLVILFFILLLAALAILGVRYVRHSRDYE